MIDFIFKAKLNSLLADECHNLFTQSIDMILSFCQAVAGFGDDSFRSVLNICFVVEFGGQTFGIRLFSSS